VKYYCEACERLVPPATFRVEGRLLVLKCSRCKVETRCEPEQDEPSAAAPVSKSSTPGPVIMLAGSDAEPDPIENEPTRRIAVPASVLAAIEAEAMEARAKKTDFEKAPEAREPEVAKSPAPELSVVRSPEPVATRTPEPVPTKAHSSRMVMSEAAAANLVVLRLSEVGSRKVGEPTSPPAAEPAPVPPPSVQARAVPEPSVPPREKTTEDPFTPPPGYCPKCIGGRKEGAVVCPFCGLEYARFRPEEFHGSPALHSTWLGVLELWESKGAHDKVLALASERGELAILGRFYRIRLAHFPEDAQAKRGREEVLRLAAAGSGLMPSSPPDKRAKMKVAMQGLLVFALVVAAMFIVYKARGVFLGP
jgi:hypothetical protein